MWAVGITLYIFIFAKLPKYVEDIANNVIHMTGTVSDLENSDFALNTINLSSIQRLGLDFPEDSNASAEVKDLLQSILKINAEERLTLDQILDHPWVSEAPPRKTTSTGHKLLSRFSKARSF